MWKPICICRPVIWGSIRQNWRIWNFFPDWKYLLSEIPQFCLTFGWIFTSVSRCATSSIYIVLYIAAVTVLAMFYTRIRGIRRQISTAHNVLVFPLHTHTLFTLSCEITHEILTHTHTHFRYPPTTLAKPLSDLSPLQCIRTVEIWKYIYINQLTNAVNIYILYKRGQSSKSSNKSENN